MSNENHIESNIIKCSFEILNRINNTKYNIKRFIFNQETCIYNWCNLCQRITISLIVFRNYSFSLIPANIDITADIITKETNSLFTQVFLIVFRPVLLSKISKEKKSRFFSELHAQECHSFSANFQTIDCEMLLVSINNVH